MASTARQILTNPRVIILIIALVLAFYSINPQFDTSGVVIKSVLEGSPAQVTGIDSPKETTAATALEVIHAINNEPVENLGDYQRIIDSLEPNQTVSIETDEGFYTLFAEPEVKTEIVGKENRTVSETVPVEINGSTINQTRNVTREVNLTKETVTGVKDLGLRVSAVPSSNIVKGLDLQGGTRVLLQPERQLSQEEMERVLDNLKQRLNLYGLADRIVREANDLSGNQYVLVEIAGATEEQTRELLASQGKFEAQVGNQTVFSGGDDITYVCRSAGCSGIDPNVGCSASSDGAVCRFQFQISLSPEAAQRQADVTGKYPIIDEQGSPVLSEKLVLVLDGEQVDALSIAADLRGREVTDISISGSGSGASQELAIQDALDNMRRLQTLLETGSLPVKLNIVQTKNISPQLGDEFLHNAILIGIAAVLAVILVVSLRYRQLAIAVPMLVTMLSEVFLILGFAALFRWNLDLTAIAGIIIAVGSGVDDQIVITDETLEGESRGRTSWKEKLKRAFSIIFTAWCTTFVAMIPLYRAGAGVLRGFAFATMVGITMGVLITRPAFAKTVEILLKK